MEAITLGKKKEIKDSLHLKLCNSNIHTSVSHFMDIQQKDNESLAAYIHRFKREAKKCNLTNNAATIRIFIKGLKNTHILAACIYDKGSQTLTDTISEVEKLQAAQQLTATLLPFSTVNVMTNEGDQCFQCQELGHIAHNCPNMCCFECYEYGHIAADCLDKMPPSGTPVHQKRWHTRHHTRSTSRHHHWERHRYSRLRSQSYSHGYQSNSHNSSYRSHLQSHHRHPHRSTSQHCHPRTNCYCHDTPHRKYSSHRSLSTHSRDNSRSRTHMPYKPSKNTTSKSSSRASKMAIKPQDKRQKRVTIDYPQSEFYSLDDT